MALWPSTPETSTLRDIICDHIHKLKTVHYTFLLLLTPKGFRLAKHEFSKIILLWKKPSPFYCSFLKSKEMFCLEMWIVWFLHWNPWGTGTFSQHYRSTFIKTSFKKEILEFFWVCKNTVTFKIDFNWKRISRIKFQTKSRKFSFNHSSQ